MSLTPEQIAIRRHGMGSSDGPAILGLSRFATAFDVYLSKAEGFDSGRTFSSELGDLLEPVVLELHRRRTGATHRFPGTVQHPTRPLLLDTPDAIADFDGGKSRMVEAKAPRYRSTDWGDDGSDGIEESYIVQCQHHMLVQRARGEQVDATDVPVLFGAQEFYIYEVLWDEELAHLVAEECEKFWRDHVLPRKPPPMDGSRFAPAWLKQKFPVDRAPILEATADDEDLALSLRDVVRTAGAAKQAAEDQKNRWRLRIGEAAGVKTSQGIISWKANQNGTRVFRTPKHWSKDDGE